MYKFNKIFPFVKKEFGKNTTINSVDGKTYKAISYLKNKSVSNQSYFNDKVLYCDTEIKPGDIVLYLDKAYMCIRQVYKDSNYWTTTVRQCDFVTKFVVGSEVKSANSYYMTQNFKISEGYNLIASDSSAICVIPDYAWTSNLIINQKVIQFGYEWLISGLDKTNKGLVYLYLNRGDKATATENESGIPDGSEIYSTQILWEEFPGYLESGNKYPVSAKLYKQLPDLSWVPTLDTITYRSSDSSIAYVDSSNLLNCVKTGEARIYAEYPSDYSKTIYRDIYVNESFVNYRMEWTNSISSMYEDDVYTFTAQIFKNDTAITVPILYEIPSEYSEIAELGINGKVTAKKVGSFVIKATWVDNPNYSISKTVEVLETTYSIKFTNYTNKLKLNSQTEFTALVYKNGIIDAAKVVRYSSDNPSTVQIDGNTGTVTPVGLGKAKIKAYMLDDDTVYSEIEVEVFEVVYSIIWRKQITEMMYVGQTYQIEAVVGVDLEPDLSKSVGYRSSDDSVVIVDSQGNVTPVSTGQAELTAYYVDDESVQESLLVNVSLNKYTIEWINPESASNTFISSGDYNTTFPDKVDLGVIVKRDGVDVTDEYTTSQLYHFKTGDQYSKAGFNGRYIYGGGRYTFRQISVTISIPDVPNSPELVWEGVSLPISTGSVSLTKLLDDTYEFPNSAMPNAQIQILPDTSVVENGLVLNQDTLLSTDILFLINDYQAHLDGERTRYYLFKYSDIFRDGVLVQTYTQGSDAKYYKSTKEEIPFYIKNFFEVYPDVIYPIATSNQPEVITPTNTPKQHFLYLRGNYIQTVQVSQGIKNYSAHVAYEYRGMIEVKQPNGVGIYLTFGKNIVANAHNGIMGYATLNGIRLDDSGMVFEVYDSNGLQVELRRFPKVVEGHFGYSGKPNVIKSILNTDDGWSAFSDAYKERILNSESDQWYYPRICPYPYNRQIYEDVMAEKYYFVNQSWKFERDESGELVYEDNMRDVFVLDDITSNRVISIKVYHRDYPNFYEIREFTVYPHVPQILRLSYAIKTDNSDTLEYEAMTIKRIQINDLPDNDAFLQPTYKISYPSEYKYISFFIEDENKYNINSIQRLEDRYDCGYWHISWCKYMDGNPMPMPNLLRNLGTTSYPRQTIVHVDDWDSITGNTIYLYVQPASLLVDSSRYAEAIYYFNPDYIELNKEIDWVNQFPKGKHTEIVTVPNDHGNIYETYFYNYPKEYETHVVEDSKWIDLNYDKLTDFSKLYGTKYSSPYPEDDYESVDMTIPYRSGPNAGDVCRLHEKFMFFKFQIYDQ